MPRILPSRARIRPSTPRQRASRRRQMFISAGRGYLQEHERRSCHEPGNYRHHHWCAGHHRLGDSHSSAHLTADRGPPRHVFSVARGQPSRRKLAPRRRRSLTLCFAAFGVLRCQILVGGREILTAQAGPVQKLEKFSYVRQQSRGRTRPPGLLSCDFKRCQGCPSG